MVEQEAVNFEVAGSSPVPGAISGILVPRGTFLVRLCVLECFCVGCWCLTRCGFCGVKFGWGWPRVVKIRGVKFGWG